METIEEALKKSKGKWIGLSDNKIILNESYELIDGYYVIHGKFVDTDKMNFKYNENSQVTVLKTNDLKFISEDYPCGYIPCIEKVYFFIESYDKYAPENEKSIRYRKEDNINIYEYSTFCRCVGEDCDYSENKLTLSFDDSISTVEIRNSQSHTYFDGYKRIINDKHRVDSNKMIEALSHVIDKLSNLLWEKTK
jgi:hypothetical protein